MSRNRGSDRSPVSIFSQKAPTLFEAIRKITTKSARKMYVAHIRLVIFDKQTARNGIKEPLDFLFRDHEVRPDFYMVVTKGTSAKDVVSFITPTEILPSIGMYKTLKVSEKVWAPTSAVKVTEMLKKLTKTGVEPVLTWGNQVLAPILVLFLVADYYTGIVTGENQAQEAPTKKRINHIAACLAVICCVIMKVPLSIYKAVW